MPTQEEIEKEVKKFETKGKVTKKDVQRLTRKIQTFVDTNDYHKKDYCENCNGILGYDCTYIIPDNENSKGILTVEHWDGNPHNNLSDNLLTLCGNCARYKTNLFEDWATPGRNLKLIEGSNWVIPVDFIWKDWVARINNKLFKSDLYNIKIIVGITGQGKTFSIAEYIIPELDKQGVQFIQVSAPQHGILDIKDFKKAMNLGFFIVEDASVALQLLKDGEKVLYLSTHSAMISDRGRDLLDYCKDEDIKHAIIIDEIHTWLCTDAESYKDTVGHLISPDKDTGTLYRLLSKISAYNPYIFGLTATPNGQQTGKVPIGKDGKTTFEIINKMCPLPLMWRYQSSISEETLFLDLDNIDETLQRVKEAIITIENHRIKTGVKKTLLIQCQTSASNTTEYQSYEVIKFVQNVYNEMGYGDEWRIAEMRSASSGEFGANRGKINKLYKGDGSIDASQTENSLKTKLIDNNDDTTVLVVVNKGGMGMNIRNLGGFISLKGTNKKDSKKNPLIEFMIQGVGRCVRPLVSISQKEYSEKYDFDFLKYYESLNTDEERENAVLTNSFFYMLPDNEMCRAADEVFRKTYANDISFVRETLSYL